MGVHGLWTLLEPVGKPVPLESLENKVLAVDVSIWLHQATKGFRDAQGNPLPNAHLLGLCHRLCKLLYYKIRPVFVFDGGVPILKRQTIAARQSKRFTSIQVNNKIAEKILSNYIKSEAINNELGNKGKGKALLPKRKQEPDLFELPPQIPNNIQESESEMSDDEFEELGEITSISSHLRGHNIHSVDVTSNEFLSLPAEVQHEILIELKETRKQSSWSRMNQMPQEAKEFSGFQIERLLKRRNLQRRLNEVEKEISRKTREAFEYDMDGEVAIMTQRIVSDNTAQYVLIKKALEKKELAPIKTEENVIEAKKKEEPVITSLSDDEDLTQEEILTIVKNDNRSVQEAQQKNVMPSSSSDDSDFEEVKLATPQPKIILSIPIDIEELENEDDMFADVFVRPSTTDQRRARSPLVAGMDKNEITYASEVHVEEKSAFVETVTPAKDGNIVQACKHEDAIVDMIAVELPEPEDTTEENINVKNSVPEQLTITEDFMIDKEIMKEVPPLEVVEITSTTKTDRLTSCARQLPAEASPSEVNSKHRIEPLEQICEKNAKDTQAIRHLDTSNRMQPPEKPKELDEAYRKRLEEMDKALYEEQFTLVKERGKQERLAASLTDQIYAESQEMLERFGIPYLVAPMEAEAQCAYLDEAGLTQGTITDDSDIWLFGGRRVYKNFFNQSKYVEYFEVEDVFRVFKMRRQQLISLALLTGSDYTEGLQGVGPVCALEILAEFPGDGLEQLENFKEWLTRVQKTKNAPPGNKIREKLRNLQLRPGFPNKAVVEAYINPEVNKSREKFSWKEPDLESLKDYLHEKIGWNREKFNNVVLPVLERFKTKEYQTRIDSFFTTQFTTTSKPANMSKRVLEAIRKADFQSSQDQEVSADTSDHGKIANPATKKRRSNGINSGTKRTKKPAATKATESAGEASGNTSQEGGEKIWQREKDRQILASNKLRAIEILKRSRGRGGKRLPRPLPLPDARLSESDSSSS